MVTALRAGVDIVAHLPSYDLDVKLSDETITLAVESKAALVTTLTVAKRYEVRSPEKYQKILQAQRSNLRRLHAAGARLVLGSDNFRDTSVGEANHLAELGALENVDVLNMWTRNCAETVFPNRKVGRLEDGYEASFLVLEGSPLEDFSNTSKIAVRVKDAALLDLKKSTQ